MDTHTLTSSFPWVLTKDWRKAWESKTWEKRHLCWNKQQNPIYFPRLSLTWSKIIKSLEKGQETLQPIVPGKGNLHWERGRSEAVCLRVEETLPQHSPQALHLVMSNSSLLLEEGQQTLWPLIPGKGTRPDTREEAKTIFPYFGERSCTDTNKGQILCTDTKQGQETESFSL